jgi:hypothetical protein
MDSTIQLEKAVSWPEEVELFEKYEGSLAGFCRSRGLSEVRFRYWEQKLRKPRKSKAVSVSPFVSVKVEPKAGVSMSSLPDPRWLAEFILHLNGSRQ